MTAAGKKRPRPGRRPGFWARAEVRRYLPVAIGVLAMVLLVLTFAVAPRGRRRPAEAAPAAAAPEPATISERDADLRRGPDSRSEVVVTLRRGSAITLVEQKGIWCRVRDASGREGFLLRHSVERDADRALRSRRAETIFRFAPLSGDVADDTPLLLAPFSFAAVWGEAGRGDSLPIYSVDHGYYATKLPDGTLGFVASEDVDVIPADPAEPALTPGAGKVVKEISVSEQSPQPAPAPPPIPGMPDDVPAPGPVPPGIPPAGVSGEAADVAPAVLLQKVEPVYPPAAFAARVAGTVVLQVSIDREGNVGRIEVKRQAPLGMTEAAIAAVQRWRYKPATALGGPIPSMKLVRIEFKPPE
ncbi:MAG TPA: TonB family protein [Thermoanaerobaculia bacterium]|nr:TonB family protein [Thermoanaerobaculia bacterium]